MYKSIVYKGEQYSFRRAPKSFAHGGNGHIYDVELINPFDDKKYVAKFFHCKNKATIRYNRFKREAKFISGQGIDGIVPLIDKHCPELLSGDEDAWYLMPKAEQYKVNHSQSIVDKLDDMLCLARIIERLHGMKKAHRDIKPENILLFNNQIALSDFGLLWEDGEERLTETAERIGPYRILPPELENVIGDEAIDFRPSDVYLFAKVLWMVIKNDNFGFRGEYKRGDKQIYLNKDVYSENTFEPLHKLLENATIQDPTKRINISQCIRYLELQLSLLNINHPSREQLSPFLYDEICKKFTAHAEPCEYVYDSISNIADVLSNLLPNASITILINDGVEIPIITPSISISAQNVFTISSFVGSRLEAKYCFSVKKLIYITNKGEIEVVLDNLEIIEMEFEPISNYSGMFRTSNRNFYLSSNERLLIRKEQAFTAQIG